jgi:hypothetical protein
MITAEGKKRKWAVSDLQASYQATISLVPWEGGRRSIVGRFYHRIFTPLVTVWCLIYQRLSADHRCEAVISYLKSGAVDEMERHAGKAALSQRLKSESTASYCQARRRLPLGVLHHGLWRSGEIVHTSGGPEALWQGRDVYLLDGSTILLRPEPELVAHYGIHRTQKKESYWVLLQTVVAFCLGTGAVRFGSEGTERKSEHQLAMDILARSKVRDVYLADRAFGIFSVVQAALHYGADVVVRLSRPRANKLYGRQLYPGCDHWVTWAPSKKDKPLVSPLSGEPITGRLIYVRLEHPGYRSQDLYLFTTLLDRETFSRQALVELYGKRWHVELNLRYVKDELDMHLLTAKSVDMVRKELFAGFIAYNLIRGFMVQAARQAGASPLTLSFASSWRRVRDTVFHLAPDGAERDRQIEGLVRSLSRCRLVQRSQVRLEPRQKHYPPKTYPELRVSRAEARQRLIRRRLALAVC